MGGGEEENKKPSMKSWKRCIKSSGEALYCTGISLPGTKGENDYLTKKAEILGGIITHTGAIVL